MKFGTIALAAGLVLAATAARAEHYVILRPAPSLYADASDLVPKIEGDVTAVDAQGVDLDGGAVVPVKGAAVHVGDHATFVCAFIDKGTPPGMRDCKLDHAEKPAKPAEKGKLW